MSPILLDKIDRFLRYDDITGELFWRLRPGKGVRKGSRAGFMSTRDGTIYVTFRRHTFSAHKIAWFLGHGEWPTSRVIHLNGLRYDNSLDNLALWEDLVALKKQSPQCLSHRGP